MIERHEVLICGAAMLASLLAALFCACAGTEGLFFFVGIVGLVMLERSNSYVQADIERMDVEIARMERELVRLEYELAKEEERE